MRRLVVGLSIVFLLGFAGVLRAQTYQSERQDPKEYTNDDGQPLKIASYFIAPVGFVLDWTVARPLHYLATETFMASALNPDADRDYPLPRLAKLPPPDKFPPEPSDQAEAGKSAEPGTVQPGAPSAPARIAPPVSGQPALH